MRAAALATARSVAPGLGAGVGIALLVPMEAGIPIPVPADLVMLTVGDRVAAGALPLWAAVLAFEAVAVVGTAVLFLVARGPGHAVIARLGPRLGLTDARLGRATALVTRRGRPALAIGRGTPGLRTLTVVAAGGSGLSLPAALPALALGASVFLQLHLFLGYLLGPTARDAFDQAKGPAVVTAVALVAGAVVFWLVRRGRRAGGGGLAEAACPACLALAYLSERAQTPDATSESMRPTS